MQYEFEKKQKQQEAVSYAIVRRHGGHLTVTSSLQKGTTVDVYIPVYKEK